jgi:hypothetical protein
MMFSFDRVIAFAAYSVALLGAIYWTFFVFTDFLEPTHVRNVQDYQYAVDVKPGVASLEVYIPSGQKSDNYQNVRMASFVIDLILIAKQVGIVIDGQTVSLMLDTSFADLFVASSECDSAGPESPCYNTKQPYHITVSIITFPRFAKLTADRGTWQRLKKIYSIQPYT